MSKCIICGAAKSPSSPPECGICWIRGLVIPNGVPKENNEADKT